MKRLHQLLHHPFKVLTICACFATISLLFNGGIFQLYRLHRDQATVASQIQAAKIQVIELNQQLKMAKDPVYIERQALENYDLIDERDLVFVFSEE